MPVTMVTGSAFALYTRLGGDMRRALAEPGEEPVVLVVPGQLTLETEQYALASAGLNGSFRLQVLSPARLWEKVFEQAGRSEGSRIDERGRAMLMRRALDAFDGSLRVYEGARRSAGFAALAAEMVLQWKGAGLRPEDVSAIAARHEGTPLAGKLADIATLYAIYEETAAGLAVDEEDARRDALARLPRAPFFRGARVWFYGFDLLTNPVAETVLALARVAAGVTVLFPMRSDPLSRDARLYAPAQGTLRRAVEMLEAEGIGVTRAEAAAPERTSCAARVLEEELFSYPAAPCLGPAKGLALHAAPNPRAEAEHAAAAIRFLVRKRGWRYADIAVACQSPSTLYSPLRRAFALYDIPVFFPETRMAQAHPLCAALLAAVRAAAGPVREDDMQTLLGSGYSPLSDDEADRARNFAFEHGVVASRWLRPYLPGADPEGKNAAFEELRARLAAPVLRLREGLRKKETRAQLEAIVDYLGATGSYERMLAEGDALAAAGQPVAAAEGAQVWGRILSSLDQIAVVYAHASAPTSAKTLSEMLRQTLSVTELKPLPQSADAVAVGSLEHMKTRPVKAVVIVGATDADEGDGPSLLLDSDREALREEVWLGPDKRERALMRLLAAKEAVSFAEETLLVSWHTAASDGSVCRPGALVRSVRAVFPELTASGGVTEDAREERLRLLAPEAACVRLGEALRRPEGLTDDERAALNTLASFPEYRERLAALMGALEGDPLPESIAPDLAERLYDGPRTLSVTRLELYARCPFSHFVRYGARPEELREWGITPRDAGDICHEALDRFVQLHPEEQDIETALRHMDAIAQAVLDEALPGLREESAVSREEAAQLRATARSAALTHLRQMGASRFVPAAAEAAFRGENALPLEGARLEGRIDRVDIWRAAGEDFLRVVDYTRGGRQLQLAKVFYGLQLQLMIYLVAAGAMFSAQPAAALYFNVSDPLVDTRSIDPDEIAAERGKMLRLSGAVLAEEEVVRALSDPPEVSLTASFNQDGSLRKSDRLFSREDLALLARRAVEQAEESLRGMRQGEIGAHPVRLDRESAPCVSCPYAAVCRQDPYAAASRERALAPLSAKEVLELLRDE